MRAWLSQTSTRAALGTLLTTAGAVAAGQVSWQVAIGTTVLPVLYGALVSDKP